MNIFWTQKATLRVSSKVRNDFSDYDYVDILSEKDKKWLYSFHREYMNADFKHGGKILHTSKKSKIGLYGMNNARNRDAYAISKSVGMLKIAAKVKELDDGTIVPTWYKYIY